MGSQLSVEMQVSEKVEFAKRLHKNALAAMKEWEQLYKGEYSVPKDKATKETEIHSFKPGRPRAIIAKMLALLSLRARMQNQVVPKKDTQEEETICTRLEEFLQAYQWRIQTEKNQPVFRHAVQWGLLRGKVVLIAQYVPRFVGSEYLPIRTVAPDPATVFEVPGENGVMYFVRESERYALELSRELNRRMQSTDGEENQGRGTQSTDTKGQKARWVMPGKLLDKRPTDKCKVTEYWDGEYYSVLVDDEMVLAPSEHEYGFCPIAVAYLEDTPFPEMEWKGQGILAPITDAIKNEAMLMAKLGDAVSSFFYPLVFWKTPDGRGGWINPYVANIGSIPADAKIEIHSPQPNIPIIQAYRQWLQSDVNLMTLPDIAWGLDAPSTQSSGFAISQVLGQVMDRIQDKKENLQFAFGTHFGQVLRLTAQFANRAEGGRFEIMTLDSRELNGRQQSTSDSRKRRLLAIGPAEVAEHFQVLTRITPTLPTEKMAMIQQMNALREPSKLTGLPLVDDKSLREMYPEIFENVDVINQRVDEEMWRKKLPEIEQWEQDEYMQMWRRTHKPHGTQGADLNKLSKPELVQMVKMLEMMIGNPEAFGKALERMGTPTPAPPPSSTREGSMLPPQILPPQMQGAGPANPEERAAEQLGRALVPPK